MDSKSCWEKYIKVDDFYHPKSGDDRISYGSSITYSELLEGLTDYLEIECVLSAKKHPEFGNPPNNITIIGRPKFKFDIDYYYFHKSMEIRRYAIRVREVTSAIVNTQAMSIDRFYCISPERIAFDIKSDSDIDGLRQDLAQIKSHGTLYIELTKKSVNKYGCKSLPEILDQAVNSLERHSDPWRLSYYNPNVEF